ncbi:MAG: hypothetical protein NZZ41_04785 [Candidatus Dojkabacteria bacterium]|nr:hypothetical protein [Candidatus Dojkabacteria bacterium]
MTQTINIIPPHHYEVIVDSVIIRNNFINNMPDQENPFTIIIDRMLEPKDQNNNRIGNLIRINSLYLQFKDIKNDIISLNDNVSLSVEQIITLCSLYIQQKKYENIIQ